MLTGAGWTGGDGDDRQSVSLVVPLVSDVLCSRAVRNYAMRVWRCESGMRPCARYMLKRGTHSQQNEHSCYRPHRA